MLPDYEIVLGKGIGKILFGIPKKELIDTLGEPDEIEYSEDPDKTDWEIYWYNSIKCSFTFDPDNEDRMVEIVVENGYFHIARKIRVGVGKEDVLAIGEVHNFGEYLIEDRSDEENPSDELISYPHVGLHLRLDEGIITAIQISPLFKTDGSIIWPEPEQDLSMP